MGGLSSNWFYNELWHDKGSPSDILHVTPYKICVVLFIQEYCLLKTITKTKNIPKRVVFHDTTALKPVIKKDFCMIALLLTGSPDMEFQSLMELLSDGKYQLQPELLDNFKKKLSKLLNEDVGCVYDIFMDLVRVMNYYFEDTNSLIKNSKIGIYMRRIRLYFDKISFDQMVQVYKGLHRYLKKNSTVESKSIDTNKSLSNRTMDMEFSSIQCDSSITQMTFNQSVKNKTEVLSSKGLWSKNQVELFIAQQSRLLAEDPGKALPPHELQAKIREVLATSSDHCEAHFLSYLNCVRSKELNGALDSQHHYFDRKLYLAHEEIPGINMIAEKDTDMSKGLRLAALNQGILHALFNKRKEAICALNEAVTLAHEANDNMVLQYAQTWLYKLNNENRETLIEKSLAKSQELNLNYLLSFGYQAYSQHAAFSQQSPASVFQLVSLSETLSCQYQMIDLMATSMVQRAALWSMYGWQNLASLCAQQLLNLASGDPSVASSHATVISLATLTQQLAIKGEYEDGWKVIDFMKSLPIGKEWVLWSEAVLTFTESLHKGEWQRANTAVNQLALVDNTESLLKFCEMLLAKGDRRSAYDIAHNILNSSESPISKTRALRIIAKSNKDSAYVYLSQALHIATSYYLNYFTHLITFDMVEVQVEMGVGCQASRLGECALLGILSQGCFSDMADCLFLYAKSKVVAESPSQDLVSVVRLLDDAQHYAKKISDFARVKNIAYFQALLCDKLGMTSHRNKYAFQFRTLDEQFPSYNAALPKAPILKK